MTAAHDLLQQTGPLFDHLVGAHQPSRRDLEPNERAFAGEDNLFDVRERLQVYDLEEREMSFRRGRR